MEKDFNLKLESRNKSVILEHYELQIKKKVQTSSSCLPFRTKENPTPGTNSLFGKLNSSTTKHPSIENLMKEVKLIFTKKKIVSPEDRS